MTPRCSLCQDEGTVLHKRGPNDRYPVKGPCPRCKGPGRMLKADPPESVDMRTAAKLLSEGAAEDL